MTQQNGFINMLFNNDKISLFVVILVTIGTAVLLFFKFFRSDKIPTAVPRELDPYFTPEHAGTYKNMKVVAKAMITHDSMDILLALPNHPRGANPDALIETYKRLPEIFNEDLITPGDVNANVTTTVRAEESERRRLAIQLGEQLVAAAERAVQSSNKYHVAGIAPGKHVRIKASVPTSVSGNYLFPHEYQSAKDTASLTVVERSFTPTSTSTEEAITGVMRLSVKVYRPEYDSTGTKTSPGGLLSQWLADYLKVGDDLQIRGPTGLIEYTGDGCFMYVGREVKLKATANVQSNAKKPVIPYKLSQTDFLTLPVVRGAVERILGASHRATALQDAVARFEHVVFICGGSGVTPCLAIMKAILNGKQAALNSRLVTLSNYKARRDASKKKQTTSSMDVCSSKDDIKSPLSPLGDELNCPTGVLEELPCVKLMTMIFSNRTTDDIMFKEWFMGEKEASVLKDYTGRTLGVRHPAAQSIASPMSEDQIFGGSSTNGLSQDTPASPCSSGAQSSSDINHINCFMNQCIRASVGGERSLPDALLKIARIAADVNKVTSADKKVAPLFVNMKYCVTRSRGEVEQQMLLAYKAAIKGRQGVAGEFGITDLLKEDITGGRFSYGELKEILPVVDGPENVGGKTDIPSTAIVLCGVDQLLKEARDFFTTNGYERAQIFAV